MAAAHLDNSCEVGVSDVHQEVATRLLELEAELRRLALWEADVPTAEALSSPLPFCHDTMYFPQWLQFVFLVRMRELLKSGAPLPRECGIAPYADEYFKPIADETAALRALLAEIDEILTTPEH